MAPGRRPMVAARGRVVALAAAVVLAGLLGACDANDGQDRPPAPTPVAAEAGAPPFADCATLAAPPAKASADAPATKAPSALPAVTLDCVTGGASVPVQSLRGPAVVNLWATWCPPCREELPVFQQLADQAGDRVHVVGIDTRDDRGEAIRLADRLGVSFPTLADPNQLVLRAVGAIGLPVTLFVDRGGQVRHVYNGKALDGPRLSALLEQHLGLAVNLG